ncbi:filamentous hemagglutinin N-terminal domain-containing protein [Tolypothrix sp. VBCCA 56010]|uniref:two-partner secretion domain-containing protein n=1 Tax=Tolypothrix sp. VBCCA 56010 TaxID=3137731 RepID=UPI003D7E328D
MNNKQSLLPSFLLCSFLALPSSPAIAQITPDNTLGAENSRLTPNALINGVNADKIEGGAQRGSNLFHSFTQFNINDGQRVYFGNPVGVENILTRVTGGNASNIFGTLGVDGAANLFLINPNGILFGQNARLDVRGSFLGTTANAIQFGNQGVFSATNPQAPPLLTVNPSGLLFNQLNQNAAIQNNSIAQAGKDPAGVDVFGLRVPDGKSLLLVGGNVSMDGGGLFAFGGRVELFSLAEAGSVGIQRNDNNLSLSFPDGVGRADVSLTNEAYIDVTAGGGGSIAINARNIDVLAGTTISTGIASGLGSINSKAGDIEINATGDIKVEQSRIINLLNRDATGNNGDIRITTSSLSLTNGTRVVAVSRGQGNPGNINIDARETVSLDGQSAAFSFVQGTGKGCQAGDIKITAGSVFMTNGSQFSSTTAGEGNAGSVIITARDKVSLDGGSDIFTTVRQGAFGNGGNINISTGSLSVTKGSQLGADSFGQGNAGDVTISAREAVSFDGRSEDERFASVAGSILGADAEGRGGNINITGRSLSVTNGAQLQTSTLGRGDAGNLTVAVREAVSFDGTNGDGDKPSAAVSRVEEEGVGNGGDITITAGSLSLTNGSQLLTDTRGRGNSGNIQINTSDSVSISGTTPVSGRSSALFTSTDDNSTGKGGNIRVDTSFFRVSDGALLNAQTRNNDNAGNITMNTSFFEALNGGQLITTTSSSGNAGKIAVNATNKVTISGADTTFNDRVAKFGGNVGNIGANSGLFVLSESSGSAGDIEINSPKLSLDNQGRLIAESASGNGGNINLQIGDLLLLRNNSLISATAGTDQSGGDGGNITINSPFIVAVPNENSDIIANAYSGKGGNINIRAQSILGIEARPKPSDATNDITASSELGVQGQIDIIQPEVQPTEGLIELPNQVVDASNQIAQDCGRGRNAKPLGEFIVTGRGIPPNSLQPLNGTTSIAPLATLESDRSNTSQAPIKAPTPPTAIIEAQGWVKTADGKIALVALAPQATPSAPPTTACANPSQK